MVGMVCDLNIKEENMVVVVVEGFLIVIDLVDWCVKMFDILFRDVYKVVGGVVLFVEKKGKVLLDFILEEL